MIPRTRVGFTGTRNGMTAEQIARVYAWITAFSNGIRGLEFHHGGCVGADTEAHSLASRTARGAWIVVHPPLDTSLYVPVEPSRVVRSLKPLSYLERDRSIVDDTEYLIAAPATETANRSGTWYTIRYATSQGKPVSIVFPNGSYCTPESWAI